VFNLKVADLADEAIAAVVTSGVSHRDDDQPWYCVVPLGNERVAGVRDPASDTEPVGATRGYEGREGGRWFNLKVADLADEAIAAVVTSGVSHRDHGQP
jgi:hypothetical protein